MSSEDSRQKKKKRTHCCLRILLDAIRKFNERRTKYKETMLGIVKISKTLSVQVDWMNTRFAWQKFYRFENSELPESFKRINLIIV